MPHSAQEVARKWQRNLAQATESMRAGVQAVTVSPTAKAAQRIDAMVAGIQRAAADGRIKAGLERVSLSDWQASMLDKGIARVATGAAQAEPKFANFMSQFLPWLEAGQQKLEAMPRGDLEQNIARAEAMMRHNAQFRLAHR